MTKKEKDGGWRLTPKSCLSIALNETSISDVDLFVEDDRHRKCESAYIILEQRMNNAGDITANFSANFTACFVGIAL